jgi:hypothetical protein
MSKPFLKAGRSKKEKRAQAKKKAKATTGVDLKIM